MPYGAAFCGSFLSSFAVSMRCVVLLVQISPQIETIPFIVPFFVSPAFAQYDHSFLKIGDQQKLQ